MTQFFFANHDRPAGPLPWIAVIGAPLLAAAWLTPTSLPLVIGGFLAAGTLVVAFHHLTAAWVVWLMLTSLSLEMTATDLIAPEAFQAAIAAEKGCELGLVALTVLKHGMTLDRFNPAWGFAAIAGMGTVAGIHPDLSFAEMLRSLIGSVTPFLLFFCVKPPGWGQTIRRAVCWAPLLSVVLGLGLDLAGLRPLFVDSGGARLAALGHPAFLAGVCLPAIYAGVLRWLRTASGGAALLVGVNLTILFLTGERAPTAYAALVIAIAMLAAQQAAMPFAHRLVVVIAGAVAIPVLVVLGESYSSLRLFAVLAGEAGHLSGRDLLWPAFEAASAQAPWFGWGLGAGNVIIPHHGQIAQLLRTWAAHNEYLRLQVEGGYIGAGLFLGLFAAWVVSHTSRLPGLERLTMRLIFAALAVHAVTDNVLISSPACVFFAFVAAVCADAREAALPRPVPVA